MLSKPNPLPEIPNISIIRPNITRILGQNPGPYTLQGTNTYLIAGKKSSVLIDTGEGKTHYLGFLESVLESNPPVSDIILTHRHRDHVGGLRSVLNLINRINSTSSSQISSLSLPSSSISRSRLPFVWKFKSLDDSKLSGKNENHPVEHDLNNILQDVIKNFDDHSDHEKPMDPLVKNHQATPDQPKLNWLFDQQIFQLSDDSKLQILHTPGHTEDSISCLLCEKNNQRLMEESGQERKAEEEKSQSNWKLEAIFVGDTILGGSTTIFEDLRVYLDSLKKLLKVIQTNHDSNCVDQESQVNPSSSISRPEIAAKTVMLHPAHGETIHDGSETIHEYISHRLEREKQILSIFKDSIHSHDPNRYLTAESLIEKIYSNLPKAVYPAALNGINQHLKKLMDDKLILQSSLDPKLWTLNSSDY